MINIGIIDRSEFVLDSFECLFKKEEPNFLVKFSCQSVEEIQTLLEKNNVHVVIAQVDKPWYGDLATVSFIRSQFSEVKILVRSATTDLGTIREIYEQGAHGFLNNCAGIISIKSAIEQILLSNFFCSYDMALIMKKEMPYTIFPGTRETFSKRELEIVALIRQQKTIKEIGQLLEISPKTVEFHRQSLMVKTDSKKIIGVIEYLIAHGIIPNSIS